MAGPKKKKELKKKSPTKREFISNFYVNTLQLREILGKIKINTEFMIWVKKQSTKLDDRLVVFFPIESRVLFPTSVLECKITTFNQRQIRVCKTRVLTCDKIRQTIKLKRALLTHNILLEVSRHKCAQPINSLCIPSAQCMPCVVYM